MIATISQSALSSAASMVSKAAAKAASVPILAGMRIDADDGTLTLRSTDGTSSTRRTCPCLVEESGSVVVSAKTISDAAKGMADAAVTLMTDGTSLKVSCKKTSLRLNTLNADDFPAFPETSPDFSVTLPHQIIATVADKVCRAASKDTARPILQGVLVQVSSGTLRMVATDSYRLAVCEVAAEGEFEAIVPGTFLKDTMAAMSGDITIGVTANQVIMSSGDTTCVTRRIEGNFPNYKQLLPTTCNTTVTVDSQSLVNALKRVSVVAQQNPSVRFDVYENELRLFASSPDHGEASEVIDADVDGETVSVALNYHYALDCIQAVPDDPEMRMEVVSGMQPVLFKSYHDMSYIGLLMPVRL